MLYLYSIRNTLSLRENWNAERKTMNIKLSISKIGIWSETISEPVL